MGHNKGNLNLLYQLVSKALPWPLGDFQNERSFSIEIFVLLSSYWKTLLFLQEFIKWQMMNSLSTNELIQLLGVVWVKKGVLNIHLTWIRVCETWNFAFTIIRTFAKNNRELCG
jgi:hypothetical protein